MRLVEEMAFAYCGGLEEVDLPTNIDSIEDGLFADCGSLTPITIPKKVDRMGTGTFHNCYDLMEINVENAVPPVLEYGNGLYPQYAGCLDYVNKDDCVLNVPVGSLEVTSLPMDGNGSRIFRKRISAVLTAWRMMMSA